MPRFKMCKHTNGGSLQLGLDDNYLKIRYTDIPKSPADLPYNKYTIPTIDYKINGYKGELKYNITSITPGGKIIIKV